MSEQPKDDSETGNAQAGAGTEAGPGETPWADAPEQSAAADPVEVLAAENDRLKDQILRTLAEMENLRKRTEREVSDAKSYAVATFARDMLGISDNLRRALDALPADARDTADVALKTLFDGVELTERELINTLAKHKVTRIDPEGERFDPNFHQAMFEVSNPDVASGTVVQVVQPGYVIGQRVLRPAMVGIAKGGPKPAPRMDAQAGVQGRAESDPPPDPAIEAAKKSYSGEQPKGTQFDENA